MKYLLDQIATRVGVRTLALIESLFWGLTVFELVDWTVRVLSGLIAIAVGILAWRHYRLKIKLTRKDIELRDQEIHRMIQQNKNDLK